jgi:branched-chain amino acid transport system permease protein
VNNNAAVSHGSNGLSWKRKLGYFGGLIVVVVILVILPPFVNNYVQSMIIKILAFAIFAFSLNILWGYTGLFSLGHAVFFGVGGYIAGFMSARMDVDLFWIALLIAVAGTALLAAILGIFALRVSGIYFLLVTLAMGELFSNLALRLRVVTGGSNGLTNIQFPTLGIPFLNIDDTSYYYLALIITIIAIFLMYRFVKSPFGWVLQGIRENEPRMIALGFNVWFHKYVAIIISAVFAGLGGVIFAYYNGVMAPVHLGVMTSTEAMLMVIIGSCTTIFGPVLGAGIVVLLEVMSSLFAPERWPLILGGVFVLAVVFVPNGLGVYILKLLKRVTLWKP